MAADASLLPKVEHPELSSSLQLNELSILLRIELQCVCNKVYKYVGMSALMEWFQEVLKSLDTNEFKQSSSLVDVKDLSSDQFDNNGKSLDTDRPNSAASTIDYMDSSEYIKDILPVIDSDIGRQQKDSIDECPDSDKTKAGLVLREGCGSRRRHFSKTKCRAILPKKRVQGDIDGVKDALNKNTVETNLELNNSKDVQITKHQPICDICSRVCRSDIGLKLHLRMHKKLPGAPVCSECGIQLRNLYCLQEHMKLHTGERPHVCTKCGKSFRTANTLTAHVRTHAGERRYMCHQCDKRYMHRSVLAEHMRYVHSNGARPYICMHCSRTYPTTNGLRSHEIRCKSDLTHACEYCEKRYRNLWDLKHHRQIHTGEKLPITAAQECVYCKKMFKNNYIQLHIRQVHKKERPFKCSTCDMAFSMLGSLKSHQLVHSGERAFACTQCDKRLASAYALRNHEAKHRASSLSAKKSNDSDTKLLACVYCNERFVRSSNLTVHVKMFHSTAPSLAAGSCVSEDTNINIKGQLSISSSSSSC